MKSFVIAIFTLLYFITAQAQPNYQKATVTTRNGEKQQGWINFKEWNQNPRSISFKSDKNKNEPTKYTVSDINSFEVVGLEQYERYPVKVSTDNVNPVSGLSLGPVNTSVDDTVFLKVIRKGKTVNLYSYTDNLKTRYYIKGKEDSTPVELVYKRYMHPNHSNKEVSDEQYKNQLISASKQSQNIDMAELLGVLRTTRYMQTDLGKVADMINHRQHQSDASGPSPFRFYVGAALYSSQASYSGDHALATGATNKTSFYPKVAVGVDILNKPAIGRLVYRFDVSFTGGKYEMTKVEEGDGKTTHSFDMFMLSFTPQVIYNIYNTEGFKLNAGAGVSANLSFYSNNKKTFENYKNPNYGRSEEVELKGFWVSIPLRIGAVFNKKYEVYGQYNYGLSSITSYTNYAIAVNGWQVGFNYLF